MVDYEAYYLPRVGVDGDRSARWRQLGAIGKADHVSALLARAGLPVPSTILEVGCGDGAVLAELGRRGLGRELVGLEVSESAAELARGHPEIDRVLTFDGAALPFADGAFELVLATHVLEHVGDPGALLAEMVRVSTRSVVVEVPLEDNLAARRPAALARSRAVGHVQRFSRADMRALLAGAGCRLRGDLCDPLPRSVRTFSDGQLRGTAKWAIRSALAAVPSAGTRLMTMHYAALATVD